MQEIFGINNPILDKLKANGIDTVKKLADSNIKRLTEINGLNEYDADLYINLAKNYMLKLNDKQVHLSKDINDQLIQKQDLKKKITKDLLDNTIKVQLNQKYNLKKNIKKKKIHSDKNQLPKPSFNEKLIKENRDKTLTEDLSQNKSFFPLETMQNIRFLHYKIKNIEDSIENKKKSFEINDLNMILDYVKLLNVNYKTQSQIKVIKELTITESFYDPQEARNIIISDVMYECARVLWILARAYESLSEKFEQKNLLRNAVVAMVECSKAYKTASFFSSACTRQEVLGTSLSPDDLEFKSEEIRMFAQGIALTEEENKKNYFLASQLCSGLSALTKRLYYLRKHKNIKYTQLKALFNYDMGKACHLKAKALFESSKDSNESVLLLKQKANYYFFKAERLWESLKISNESLSEKELESIEYNLSIVNDNIVENDVDAVEFEDIKNVQDPEPFIAIPENITYFLPRSTMYLTKFESKNLDYKLLKEYKSMRIDMIFECCEMEELLNQKAAIGRMIKELKTLYENNDIDINNFFELLEKYELKLNKIENAIRKAKDTQEKENPPKEKQITNPIVEM